jgi:hypothetical protein
MVVKNSSLRFSSFYFNQSLIKYEYSNRWSHNTELGRQTLTRVRHFTNFTITHCFHNNTTRSSLVPCTFAVSLVLIRSHMFSNNSNAKHRLNLQNNQFPSPDAVSTDLSLDPLLYITHKFHWICMLSTMAISCDRCRDLNADWRTGVFWGATQPPPIRSFFGGKAARAWSLPLAFIYCRGQGK